MICQKCGKKLKDVNSIARGYGPVCWEKITGEKVSGAKRSKGRTNVKEGAENYDIPGQYEFKDYPGFIPEGMKT